MFIPPMNADNRTLTTNVGQPIVAAAGLPAGWSGLHVCRKSRLKDGCRQNCLPHNPGRRTSRLGFAAILLASLLTLVAQTPDTATINGHVVDPSRAGVP